MMSARPEAELCLFPEDIHYPLEEQSLFLICPQGVIFWINMSNDTSNQVPKAENKEDEQQSFSTKGET